MCNFWRRLLARWRALRCVLGLHDWTDALAEGIDPTPAQLMNGMAGFLDYAARWCRRCPKRAR